MMAMLKTLIASESRKGREIIRQTCGIALDDCGLDEAQLQRVVHRGWELQTGFTKLIMGLAGPKEETSISTVVHVDRLIRPVYPDWVGKVMHPELECTGLAEYDLAKDVSLWLHDKQKNGGVTTDKVIYDHLKKNNMLESCGNLQDALAIQKLGVAAFKKAFGNKVVYFWKSVVLNRNDGGLLVPYLYVSDGEVVLGWGWLGNDWHDNDPAVRFASSK
ncbi:MAG: hypothetical protein V1668_02795 [Patescibacteria group bacterium]